MNQLLAIDRLYSLPMFKNLLPNSTSNENDKKEIIQQGQASK